MAQAAAGSDDEVFVSEGLQSRHRCRGGANRCARRGTARGVLAFVFAIGIAMIATPAASQYAEAEAGPVVLRWGDWQISAASARLEDAAIVFEQAYATVDTPHRWMLVADRVDVGFLPASVGTIEWLSAHGSVRLVGPNDLYVTAERMVSLRPDQRLDFVGPQAPAVIGERWRLSARRLTVELGSGRVELEGIGEVDRPAAPSSAVLGITTTMACNTCEPSDTPTGEE